MLKSYEWMDGMGLDLVTHLCFEHRSVVLIIPGTNRKGKEITMDLNSFDFSDDWFASLLCLGKSMGHNQR